MTHVTSSQLRNELIDRMATALPTEMWTGPEEMAAASLRIQALLGGTSPQEVDSDKLARAFGKLVAGGRLSNLDLQLCCAGATTHVTLAEGQLRIVDDASATQRLLDLVMQRSADNRLVRRYAFGMAHALLLPSDRLAGGPRDNAARLASHVVSYAVSADSLAGDSQNAELLVQVRDVFQSGATRQFWPWVLKGDATVLAPVQRLQTPAASWLWRSILIDAITDGASRGDRDFTACIDHSIDALVQHELVLDEGLGQLLTRVAKTTSRAEHERLRDLAVERWGSPIKSERRPYWYRWTNEEARRMVAGWLTRGAIASFFGGLGSAGSDHRRTTFWGRYAELVDDLWIFVGRHSRGVNAEQVKKLRNVLGSSVRALDDDVVNAFVLIMGNYAFVEFDTVGNALYVYHTTDLPFALDRGQPTTFGMKDQAAAVDRITHQGAWENRARERVGNLTGHWVSALRGV